VVIVPNNWAELQHYKDRSPPWIKLHKKLLDNYEYQCLPLASKALAPMLWLIASEHETGHIEADAKKLAFRLRMSEQEAADALKPLIANGFFSEVAQVASKTLARSKRAAMPETEKRREETESLFDQFWTAYPKKAGKDAARRAFDKRKVSGNLLAEMLAAVDTQKRSEQWKRDAGQFIPHPATWLNDGRWQDGGTTAGAAWWLSAGFGDRYEAENAGCREHNAAQYRGGKRITEPA
jgi:hypothetical protein